MEHIDVLIAGHIGHQDITGDAVARLVARRIALRNAAGVEHRLIGIDLFREILTKHFIFHTIK